MIIVVLAPLEMGSLQTGFVFVVYVVEFVSEREAKSERRDGGQTSPPVPVEACSIDD